MEVGQMKGVRRLADLVNKGEVFDAVYLQPALLTAALHIFQGPHDRSPEQIHLQGSAGSVAVFNGSIWHGSYINRAGCLRRTLHCAFFARELDQQTNQREYLRPETAERLSPLARYILDVD